MKKKTAFTRADIEAIQIYKSSIKFSLFGSFEHSKPEMVLRIFGRAVDAKGRMYICGYRRFGHNSEMSFSIKEGDALDFTLYQIINEEKELVHG